MSCRKRPRGTRHGTERARYCQLIENQPVAVRLETAARLGIEGKRALLQVLGIGTGVLEQEVDRKALPVRAGDLVEVDQGTGKGKLERPILTIDDKISTEARSKS